MTENLTSRTKLSSQSHKIVQEEWAAREERMAGGRSAFNPGAAAISIGAQAWITLAVTTAIYTLNVADRFIFSTLLQPIKVEFGLSDAGVSSLNLALGLVLMTFGVPAGILADKMSRRILLAAATTIFSVMTALGGATSGMWTFVATRLGVGFGEAGCAPPSVTLIADRFPPVRRGVAMTIFTLGICAGSFFGTAVAGYFADHYGWRATMVIFGVFGLPLGAVTLLLVSEPVRGAADAAAGTGQPGGGLLTALSHIYREKALLFVILGGALICTWGWGLLFWTPAFMARNYGLTTGQAGAILGQLHLVGGTTATILVAVAMHWLSRSAARVQIWSIAGVAAMGAVASIVAYTTTSLSVMVLCVWLFAPVLYMYTGPTYTLINNLSPPHLRAKIFSIFLFATSLGYLVLAPYLIGLGSDFFRSSGMDAGASLRRALEIFAPLGLVAAIGYAAAGLYPGARPKAAAELALPANSLVEG
ncbi:MFS transporter [Bradyrhizobium sp. Pear77]|uniref:MFS transporter n=1 Tax=Bradyrhizobium TaxID=374 RepID=UPI001E4D8AA7|nr:MULTISPECIES: MFS transporter [Bradyrhizobium]MCC8954354.1 MFS transporter [Bradyrhizobium altum]MCC8964386.1 MFS transporter [Bradyrhizobium oropedii]